LGRFFSPLTLPLLTSPGGELALAPRQTRITVLFCDLRGFSRQAARARGDLLGLLRRVGHALDVMTECIHAHDGVIGDFQGDAALAFWGWPRAGIDTAVAAARAALDIRARFTAAARAPDDPLSGFRCGIGIATGEAVAGRLGTSGQFKIDVFGPVVNLASRLEGITKQLQVPILVDEATSRQLGEGDLGGWARLRRLARVRPYGLDEAVTVSELLPPAGGEHALSDADLRRYEAALDAFQAGRWDEAHTLFHQVTPSDQGKDFLTAHILRHRRQPPAGWDGAIQLESK
jgi:adenylate cyclase